MRTEKNTILVADPNDARRDELAVRLDRFGFVVDDVRTMEAAEAYLQARPDCGLVLRHAQADSPSAHLAWSGLHELEVAAAVYGEDLDPTAVRAAFRSGAVDVLAWPCDDRALEDLVHSSLEQGRMRRESLAMLQNLQSTLAERTAGLRALRADLERSQDVTLEAMGDALDLRDAETEGHSKRVTAYTIELARAMRVPSAQLRIIARGAFLHDIGKIAIPDAILLKPGKLTEDEMTVMREHCQRGYDMVCKIPFLAEAAEIVLTHQEAYDGSGYPRGLQGEDIPLGSRIFAIADAMDAITSDRPYRKGMSFDFAFEEIARCRGRQFDPLIVDVFLAQPRDTWSRIRASVGKQSHTGEIFRAAA